jgi:hypothetical protein
MILRFFLKTVAIVFLGAIVLSSLLFALLQSKWAKEQIKDTLISYLKESGIEAQIDTLNGQLPFSWTIKEVDLLWKDKAKLQLENVTLRIAIFPLLKAKVAINYLKAEHAIYSYAPSSEIQLSRAWLQQQIKEIDLPHQIDIHRFVLPHIDIVNCETDAVFSCGISGRARITHNAREFLLDLSFFTPDTKQTYFELYLNGSKPANYVQTHFKVHLAQIGAECKLDGPWKTAEELLYDLPRTDKPLKGECKGIVSNVHPFLSGDWKFKSEFSLISGQEAYIQNFLLLSDMLHIKAKGVLNSTLEKSKAVIAFSLPDLSKIALDLQGSAFGKAFYQDGTYKASFQTENLRLDSFAANTVRGHVKGSLEGNEWEAEVKFSSTDADLPFASSFAVECSPDRSLSIIDFNLDISDANAHGFLSYNFQDHLCTSSLFASAKHLEPFASYFKEEELGGNFTAECHLTTQEGEQGVQCDVLAKTLRFRDYIFDTLNVQADVRDVFTTPLGQIHVLAEKVYAPNTYLERFDFSTQSDEFNWPFSLDVEGHLESPFHLSARGFWLKENALFSLELTQLFGDLSGTPFALKYPCELQWRADELNLSPFDFRIGEGHLYTVFELSPIRSLGKWDLVHFPIEVLSCFRPRFKLHGFVSTQGFFDATPDNCEGTLNAVLEEADVLHFGQKNPFRAKGSLQAHLNQGMMQLQTDLRATDEQFLDFTASLPIAYQLYPFRIVFDQEKNTSAELTAEGKLQDIFDFVNLGTNHFTGLLSCRLFLSNTLASPYLDGNIELQSGTYENYFTGITLKNIDAKFEAHHDTLHLAQFHANDDKKGEVAAQGNIYLRPQEHFPYTFDVELKNLHALGFDMIDCNLTGPLYLKGNLQQMLAQGNLLIDEAKIQITERLPYEIPTLPFTYIHRPPSLNAKNLKPKAGFLFRIDLELTAVDKVFVEGRGLNAELEGNVHLSGTNTNITASGALKLIKGEYQFSGKVFKLTEGEIVFNDKPAPSAYLNLNGTLSMPDITITAMLRGSLLSPQLTFQSNPQKPTSSILALILFNKDIAEISHTEAIQLASTLVSLSGGAGPDVLESIRKSIGVDRLNISSKPGTDEIALQIGKYLTRGIMITLSQSATSSQVIVEVELPKGFVFQAETQEEQEGKFSLKWRRSY